MGKLSKKNFEKKVKEAFENHIKFGVLCDSYYVLEVLKKYMPAEALAYSEKHGDSLNGDDPEFPLPYLMWFDTRGFESSGMAKWCAMMNKIRREKQPFYECKYQDKSEIIEDDDFLRRVIK